MTIPDPAADRYTQAQRETLEDKLGAPVVAMMDTRERRNAVRRWWNETYGTDVLMEEEQHSERNRTLGE